MEYVEVKAEELDEFILSENKRPGQSQKKHLSKNWNTNSKQSEIDQQQIVSVGKGAVDAYSTGAQSRYEAQNQTLKNIIDQKMNVND